MGYGTHARGGLLALVASVVVLLAPSAAGAQQPAPAAALAEPPSPDLIDRAEDRRVIDNERANLYRVYALKGDSRLPAAYESDTPFDGTLELRQIRRELRRMEPGPERSRVAAALRAPPPDPNVTYCDVLSPTPLPNSAVSDHFYIQYNEATLEESLTIEDYKDSLDTSWEQEVGVFGWAAPPLFTPNPAPDGLYHVRIEALAPILYGFVSSEGTYAGPVGNNPNTTWNDVDADASCMGLNQDYSLFPGTPRQALDATTAHEFNHSLQFGYGALNGDNQPDDNFIEGGATWMEDEAQDDANDNYFYLYPQFDDSMGEHDEGDIYAYWLTFRGITERFGANVPGGAEQVMQDFWEITSRNTGDNLTAMQQALVPKQRTLAGTFHDYSIAAKLMRPCGGGYFLPYCFEEAAGYSAEAGGPPESHGSISAPGGSDTGTIEDNYTINWVDLPASGSYDVTISNTSSSGGVLRATVACDTGSAVALASFTPPTVGSAEETTIPGFDPSSCASRPVVALTNEAQTAPNPDADNSQERSYRVSTEGAAAQTDPAVPPQPTEVPPDNGEPDPTPTPTPSTGSGGGGGNGGPVALLDTTAPVLQRLRVANRRFRAARAGRAISSARLGSRVRYSLSEAATVSARYARRVRGRRVGGRCRATTRSNRNRKRCYRYVLVRGTARHSGKAGANSFRITGRMNGRTLRLGSYRLRLFARDAARNTSRTRRSARFRIVRR